MKTKKSFTWSYSAYDKYLKCSRQYKYVRIDKLKEPKSEALENGIHVHQLGEDFLNHKLPNVPVEYYGFHDDMAYCRDNNAIPEETFTFTKNWGKLTGWFDKDAWLRLKIDMCLNLNKSGSRVKITDFKTGKVRKGEYTKQVELYALAKFQTNKKIKEIIPDYWFLDHGEVLDSSNDNTIKEVYLSKELPAMKKKWLERIKPMQNDTIFSPKKSWLCNYCHFRKSNGGPCCF